MRLVHDDQPWCVVALAPHDRRNRDDLDRSLGVVIRMVRLNHAVFDPVLGESLGRLSYEFAPMSDKPDSVPFRHGRSNHLGGDRRLA
jgi:hypothetical protein